MARNKPLPYANKGDLTTGDISRHLVKLTVPMIWGLFAVISVLLADTYFVGLLGTTELAALSFTFPVTLAVSHFMFGLSIAVSSVVARLIGSNDKGVASRVTLHGLILAVMMSGSLALVVYIFLDPLFKIMGASNEILYIVREYLPIWLAGSVLLSIPVNGNAAIRAAGDTLIPAIVMSISGVLNVILDPIFIFGKFGVPAFGVQGAAIATLIAYIAAASCGLYFLMVQKKMIDFTAPVFVDFKDSVRRLFVIAIPAGLANVIQPITNAIIVGILATYGKEAVAAFGVAGRVEAFSMIVIMALATSMAPVIGQNWGAGNFARVHETIRKAIVFNLLWAAIVAVILAIFARGIASAFSDNAEVIRLTALFFYIVPVAYGVGNLVFGWASAFNAIGKPAYAFGLIMARAFIFTVPFVVIGEMVFGLDGIFYGLAAAYFASGAIGHFVSNRVCCLCERDENA